MCVCTPTSRTPFCGRPGCHWPVPEPKPRHLYEPCPACHAGKEPTAGLGGQGITQCPFCRGLRFVETGVTVGQLEALVKFREAVEGLRTAGVPPPPPAGVETYRLTEDDGEPD